MSGKKTLKAPVKKTGSRIQVYRGVAAKSGTLAKKNLIKTKNGIRSRKMRTLGKKNPWILAVNKAKRELKIKGFVAVKKGSELYKLAKKYQK